MESKIQEFKEKVDSYIDNNLSQIIGWQTLGEDNIAHIKQIANDVVLERNGIMMGSKFTKAILENNLDNVIEFGDADCLKSLRLLVMVKNWVY